MEWESAEKVQKNDKGQFRAFIGGHWVPVEKAQKNDKGQYRIQRFIPTEQEIPQEQPKKSEQTFGEKVKDFFTKGEEDHQFSMTPVLESIGAGTAIGGGIGVLAGGVGAIPGAIGGAAAGAVGGLAGEIARSMGASEAEALGAELLGGGITSIGKSAATILKKATLNLHAKSAVDESMRLAESMTPASRKFGAAEKAVKKRFLGEKPESIAVAQTATQDATRAAHIDELSKHGIKVAGNEKPSDALRNVIYNNMDNLVKTGKPFASSPEMKALSGDLNTLMNRGLLSKEQMKAIDKIMLNQISKDPATAAKANEDILSLLQSGGVYSAKEEMKKKIGEEAQFAIRNRVGQYYKNAAGNVPGFNELKTLERQEFTAKSLDEIPNMLREHFKDLTSAEFKQNMANIAQSGPEGQKAFVDAVKMHFYDKSPADFMKEFNRLRRPLQDSGVMNAKALDQVRETIERIPKDIPKERWKMMAIRAFQGTAYSEIAQKTNNVVNK